MKYFPILLLLAIGCAQPAESGKKPASLEAAATASLKAYGKNLSADFTNAAERLRAGEIKNAAQFYDEMAAASKASREKAMQGYEDALTAATNPKGKFDAEKHAKACDQLASGFLKASK